VSKQDFDPQKLKKVSIDNVHVNDWNPKEENTKEFLDIVESIKTKGLRGAILVRDYPNTPDNYQIIDGHQRYTAAKKLGYKDIWVYHEPDVDEKEAKELTIWFQQQVPFNRISEAYLVTNMIDEFGMDKIELPYSQAQIDEFRDLAEFNFDTFDNTDDTVKENPDGSVSFSIKLTREQHAIVTDRLKQYAKDYELTEAQALVEIIEGSHE